MKSALQHIQSNLDYDESSEIIPSFSEWKVVSSLAQVLEKLKIVTKKFESDKSPTMQLVVKELFNLISDLKEICSSEGKDYSKDIAALLLKKIDARYPRYGTDHLLPRVAHYLDPELKGIILHEVNLFESTKEEIKQLSMKYQKCSIMQEVSTVEKVDLVESSQLTAIERLKKKRKIYQSSSSSSNNSSGLTAIEAEMIAYEHLDDWTVDSDVLSWFKDRLDQFPLLGRIVREVMCIVSIYVI